MIALATFAAFIAAAGIDNKVTITLRDADVVEVYALVSQVAETPIDVDACLEGRRQPVDVKAMPVRDLLTKLDAELGAVHVAKDGRIRVTCKAGTKNVSAKPRAATPPAPNESPMTKAEVEAAYDALEHELGAAADRSLDDKELARLLAKMVEVDQGFRKLPHGERVDRDIDGLNTRTLRAWLEHLDWFTVSRFGAQADHNAWLLVQHADRDVAFQRDVLARLTKLVDQQETARDNYAYLYDRVAVNDGKPQRYGTQGRCTGPGRWEPRPIEDAAHVDERRAWAGIRGFPKLADYVVTMSRHCS